MKVGFSLSPGGLLLPYHLGVLESLQYNKFLHDTTPIAGSSAGAIATASAACGVDTRKVLDTTVAICDDCADLGGARGRLLPFLKRHLDTHIGNEQFEKLSQRDGAVGIAYKELFPRNRPVVQSEFHDRDDLMNAVCLSSMFPFFTSNLPAVVEFSKHHFRVAVDGVFTAPLERFGCPDFGLAGIDVDRTITVSVVPNALIGGGKKEQDDCISPRWDGPYQLGRLARLAMNGSSREELTSLYDSGYKDAERWCRKETSKKERRRLRDVRVLDGRLALN